jgi:hypothetical protein
MKENTVITDIEQLTPEWLTRIIKNKGYLSHGKVTKIIRKKSQETPGAIVHFIELDFSIDAQKKPSSTEMVIKISKPNDIRFSYISEFIGRQEAKFYDILGETMNKLPIPMCYDAAFSRESGFSHVILENLSKTHEELEDWPIPPLKSYCEKAIDCIAELHAFWWDHKRLKEFSKHSMVFYIYKENSFNKKEIFKWFNNQKETLNRFLKFLEDRISDDKKELFKTVFTLYPQFAYERIIKENITVLNGDAHLWNFFYPKDIGNEKSRAILSDWQAWSIGVGCQDLAWMIGLYMYPESRNILEKDLILRYHTDLLKLGIKNYSWDECWYDYKLFILLNLYRIVWMWEINYYPSIWWPAFENTIYTIQDLSCMELLDS